jgi:hypothetical protein
MTPRIAQVVHQHRPVNSPAAQIIHPFSNQNHHQHGHHRNLLHSCLLFTDSTRRFGGFLDQAQHQQHPHSAAVQPSFTQAHGVYGPHV